VPAITLKQLGNPLEFVLLLRTFAIAGAKEFWYGKFKKTCIEPYAFCYSMCEARNCGPKKLIKLNGL
jgi:hypothetical protein